MVAEPFKAFAYATAAGMLLNGAWALPLPFAGPLASTWTVCAWIVSTTVRKRRNLSMESLLSGQVHVVWIRLGAQSAVIRSPVTLPATWPTWTPLMVDPRVAVVALNNVFMKFSFFG